MLPSWLSAVGCDVDEYVIVCRRNAEVVTIALSSPVARLYHTTPSLALHSLMAGESFYIETWN